MTGRARPRTSKRELVAVHEAAHAVVALRHDLYFDHIAIEVIEDADGPRVLGQVTHVQCDHGDDMEPRIQVSFAGVLAERLQHGAWPPLALLNARGDYRNVLSRAVPRHDDRAYLLAQARAAGSMVARYWGDVRAVADLLRDRAFVSCAEVKTVLGTVEASPPFPWHAKHANKVLEFLMDDVLRKVFDFAPPSYLTS